MMFCVVALAAALLATPCVAQARPNVLIIQTDDQGKAGTMRYMPQTRRLFAAHGVTFTGGFVTTPLCCPSRATTYSGSYAHNHGITGNDGRGFDSQATWLADLRANGYFVGLLGKYLNRVGAHRSAAEFTRQWSALDHDDPRLAATYAREFLDTAEEQDNRPWALVANVYSPHVPEEVEPVNPQPIAQYDPRPSFDEADLSDKHPSIQLFRDTVWPDRRAAIYEHRSGYIYEIQAVDEMVGQVFRDLEARGEDDTLAIFLSDNGVFLGEHSLTAKERPYDEAVRVPFYARWPGVLPPRTTRPDLVANVDIAPTIYEATGTSTSRALDGRSLLRPTGRSWLFTEGFGPPYTGTGTKSPSWVAYFDGTRHYIHWEDGFVEDYDLVQDPYEMEASNVSDPVLDAQLNAAAECAGASCP